jgi:hypothetical protein
LCAVGGKGVVSVCLNVKMNNMAAMQQNTGCLKFIYTLKNAANGKYERIVNLNFNAGIKSLLATMPAENFYREF